MHATILGLAEELLPPDKLPIYRSGVRAGFPSPAEDYLEGNVCLQDLLIEHPQATFLVRIEGESMKEAGIFDGDLAVVDRALTPIHGKIVVAVVDGDFTIKRLVYRGCRCFLVSANPEFPDIEVSASSENAVWGVVAHVIHRCR